MTALAPGAPPALASALYRGWVGHRRYSPQPHTFRYPIFMAWVDLAELDTLARRHWCFSNGRFNLVSFRRSDYLGPVALPLDEAVRQRCSELCGSAPLGPIRMLSHLRYLGHCFNPVSFYYGYDRDGSTLTHILAEITNTPWGERHQYALPVDLAKAHGSAWHFQFDKAFHVSPFLPMGLSYDWRFTQPGEALRVHMNVLDPARSKPFDATLVLTRQPISTAALVRSVLRFPFLTLQVMWRIYWHALRLKLKRNPFYDHPRGAAVPPTLPAVTSGEKPP